MIQLEYRVKIRNKEFGLSLRIPNLAHRELRECIRFERVIRYLEILKIKTIALILQEIEGMSKERSILEAKKYVRREP